MEIQAVLKAEIGQCRRCELRCEQERKPLRRLFLLSISLCDVLVSTSSSTLANAHRLFSTYVVACFLILVSLLVLSGLGFIWSTLLVVQSLPSLSKNLSDLSCDPACQYDIASWISMR